MNPILPCILYIKDTCKAILTVVTVSLLWKYFPLSLLLHRQHATYCLYKRSPVDHGLSALRAWVSCTWQCNFSLGNPWPHNHVHRPNFAMARSSKSGSWASQNESMKSQQFTTVSSKLGRKKCRWGEVAARKASVAMKNSQLCSFKVRNQTLFPSKTWKQQPPSAFYLVVYWLKQQDMWDQSLYLSNEWLG